MKVERLLALALAGALGGCSYFGNVFNGEPNIDDKVWLLTTDNKTAHDIEYLPPPCSAPGAVAPSTDPYGLWTTNAQIKPCVLAMMGLIDLRFAHYEDELVGLNSGAETTADLSVIGMGAAGGLIGGTTSQILSAASGAVTGAVGKINSDVLFSKTVDVILQQMRTARAAQAQIIEAKLNATSASAGYTSMYDAARDLYLYSRAGSWTEAMIGLQSSTGAQAQACTNQLQNTKLVNAGAAVTTTTGPSTTSTTTTTPPTTPSTTTTTTSTTTPTTSPVQANATLQCPGPNSGK